MTDVKSNQKYDLLTIGALAILAYVVSIQFDLQERLDGFCDLYEQYEADELMVVALVLIPASMLYFWRRWQEIRQANKRLGSALNEIKHLRGIIPICCACKKIRDDDGYWHEVETYFKNHLDTSFTHGICDDCIQQIYPDTYRKLQKDKLSHSPNPDSKGGPSL